MLKNESHQVLVPIVSSCETLGKFFQVLGPWFHGMVASEASSSCLCEAECPGQIQGLVPEGSTHRPLANSCMTAGMLVKVKIGSTAKGSCGEKWRLRALPWYNGEWKQGAASPGRESLGSLWGVFGESVVLSKQEEVWRALASGCWGLKASSGSSQLTTFLSFSICGMGIVGTLAP